MKYLVSFFCAFVVSACAHQGNLYQQLGEQQGITQIVDYLLFNIAEEPKILQHFNGVDIDRFRANLIVHFCEVSDGPCHYEGDSMRDIHSGMNITAAEFDRLVGLLMDALDEANIDYRIQTELIRRLATFRADIVYPVNS